MIRYSALKSAELYNWLWVFGVIFLMNSAGPFSHTSFTTTSPPPTTSPLTLAGRCTSNLSTWGTCHHSHAQQKIILWEQNEVSPMCLQRVLETYKAFKVSPNHIFFHWLVTEKNNVLKVSPSLDTSLLCSQSVSSPRLETIQQKCVSIAGLGTADGS